MSESRGAEGTSNLMLGRRAVLKGSVAGLAGLTAGTMLPNFAASADAITRGGTLTVGLAADPTCFYPAVALTTNNSFSGSKIYEFLVELAPGGGAVRPMLAKSWDIASDGLTWTFHLQPDVKWTDGTPFTSADVAWCMMEVWKKVLIYGAVGLARVESAETPDPLTVTFHLSDPVAPNLMLMTLANAGFVAPKHIWEKTDFNTNPARMQPVGTGPFVFKQFERGSYVIMERNKDYWRKGYPYVDRVIFKIIPDPGSRTAAIESGDLNLAWCNFIPLADTARLRDSKSGGILVNEDGYQEYPWVITLDFNQQNPPLDRLEVRTAIAHAIDRDFVAKQIWYGFANPADSSIPSVVSNFYASFDPKYEYSPDTANKMLDAAGLPRGADGTRFKLRLSWIHIGDEYQQGVSYVKEALGKVGIDVEILSGDMQAFFKRAFGTADGTYPWDINFTPMAWQGDPNMITTNYFASSMIKPGQFYTNNTHYKNPEVDKIIDDASRELDKAKRAEMIHELQKILRRDLPTYPIVEVKFTNVYGKDLMNVGYMSCYPRSNLSETWIKNA